MLAGLWIGAVALLGACGGNGSGSTSATSVNISLTPNGLSSMSIQIEKGGTIRFTNNDFALHQIASNPHPAHTDCPELNGPTLRQGESFTATMRNADLTCGFHDHLNPNDARFQGTIQVGQGGTPSTMQTPTTSMRTTPSTPLY
jgi:hypothetical protein